MAYETLRKLYYQNRDAYEREYQTRFHSVSATRIDFTIGDHPAFFVQTQEMSTLLYQIMALDKRVAIIRMTLPNAAITQYSIKSLIEEVHQSLSIEQINSTRKEIADTYKQKKEDRLLGMVMKYKTLLNKEPIALASCADIRKLYDEICLPEVIQEDPRDTPDGQYFRKQPVHVYSKTDKVIHTGLFPESTIITATDKALHLLHNDSITLLYRVAIFHYLFGYIHPFYNGNGRMARFICSYMLSHSLDPLIGVRLSYTINMEKIKYYRIFKETNDSKNRGDLTSFIFGFLEILLTSYTRLAVALESRMNRWDLDIRILKRLLTDKKQKEIAFLLLQVSLFSSEGLTIPDIVKDSGVGYTTVKSFLQSNEGRIMFPCVKDGRRKLYSLDLDWLDQQQV